MDGKSTDKRALARLQRQRRGHEAPPEPRVSDPRSSRLQRRQKKNNEESIDRRTTSEEIKRDKTRARRIRKNKNGIENVEENGGIESVPDSNGIDDLDKALDGSSRSSMLVTARRTPPRETANVSYGNNGDTPQIGAIAVPGVDGSSSFISERNDGSEANMGSGENVDHPHHPTVLDASLASGEENDGSNAEEILLVEAHRQDEDSVVQKRKVVKWTIGIGIFVVLVAVSIAGALFANRSGKSNEIPSEPNPTQSPTSEEVAKDGILQALIDATGSSSPFVNGSPESMAADWILNLDPMSLKLDSPNLLQRFSLAMFYFETTNGGARAWRLCNPPVGSESDVCIDNSGETRWLSGSDECSWYGVGCLTNPGIVDGLQLGSNNLSGRVSAKSLSLLTEVRVLILHNNQFVGLLPEELFGLTKMTQLDMSAMKDITGTISTRIGLLTGLRSLIFVRNNLRGTLPSEIGNLSSLTTFAIADNKSVTGSIPVGMYDLTDLTTVALYEMTLTGSISPRIGKLEALEQFLFRGNQISGSLPSELVQCTLLSNLEFFENSITGQIPSAIANLQSLHSFLGGDNLLSGTIPSGFYDLSNLRLISINRSSLRGTLSTNIGRLTKLLRISILHNNMSGSLPSEIGLLSSTLNYLAFSGNKASGSIPDEYFGLTLLQGLNLSVMKLTGSLSTLVGQLTDLDRMFLDQNFLSGTVPNEIGRCTKMTTLFMDSNDFDGTIPKEIGNLTKLYSFTLQNNTKITGTIPDEMFNANQLGSIGFASMSLSGNLTTLIGKLTNLEFFSVASNALTGTVPTEIGKLSSLMTLSLWGNLMEGEIPSNVCQLRIPSGSLKTIAADCLPSTRKSSSDLRMLRLVL